jgi:hypothetical protein
MGMENMPRPGGAKVIVRNSNYFVRQPVKLNYCNHPDGMLLRRRVGVAFARPLKGRISKCHAKGFME